jgi:hypothetical protein
VPFVSVCMCALAPMREEDRFRGRRWGHLGAAGCEMPVDYPECCPVTAGGPQRQVQAGGMV